MTFIYFFFCLNLKQNSLPQMKAFWKRNLSLKNSLNQHTYNHVLNLVYNRTQTEFCYGHNRLEKYNNNKKTYILISNNNSQNNKTINTFLLSSQTTLSSFTALLTRSLARAAIAKTTTTKLPRFSTTEKQKKKIPNEDYNNNSLYAN